ncbi:MAG TPA: hypothetical protein VGZ03_09220 [Acidimicrobiales bacterium]|jgi:hypothetical protein|nr:hypothetical protein [Acidimicrobiales bacterium]
MKRMRALGAAAACGAILSGSLGATLTFSSPAGAATPLVKVKEFVHATTTLATLKQTVAIPRGRLSGTLNPITGALRAKLALPPASSTTSLAGIGLVKATFSVVPTKKVMGKVDFVKTTITSTSVFNIHVDSLTPVGTSVNLVGNTCQTSQPITMTLTGPFVAIGDMTFSSTYTIPQFANCGAGTTALNALVAGPGNTFTATFSPFK